jgi:predicted transposase/invertase (TIGR01784 family)
MLIDFLNNLLPESSIVDLTFKDKEKLGSSKLERRAVYDIYCENDKGEKIIIELQKAKQNYFKDRTLFYSTFPIQEQAETGEWDFLLKAVYCIGILDFKFDEDRISKGEVVHTVQLKDQHHQVFYDKLQFVYLEMPHFNKVEKDIETRLDKWLYFIKNLEDFQNIPELFKDDVFKQAFMKAEIAKYTKTEQEEYQQSLKIYRDLKNVIDTAYDEGKLEGKLEGRLEGRLEVAKSLKQAGVPLDVISNSTGMSITDLNKL